MRCLEIAMLICLRARFSLYHNDRLSIITMGDSRSPVVWARLFMLGANRMSVGIPSSYTADVAYFFRSRLRKVMAAKLSITTISNSKAAVV
jgi:hypothetical protein